MSVPIHKKSKINSGFQLNHRWFKSPQVGSRLPEFEKKELLLPKLVKLETICENLTYGSQKPANEIRESVELFNEAEKLLKGLMENGE